MECADINRFPWKSVDGSAAGCNPRQQAKWQSVAATAQTVQQATQQMVQQSQAQSVAATAQVVQQVDKGAGLLIKFGWDTKISILEGHTSWCNRWNNSWCDDNGWPDNDSSKVESSWCNKWNDS